ncbi:MAG: nuclear transport factor 2 family protein [Methyloceanibacter sp.]
MTKELPQPIERFFAGKNAGDFATALSAFSDAAVVTDEKQTYATKDAIRAWMEETSRKYRDRAEVKAVVADGGTTRVTALVSGNFPGSPAALQFRFVLDDGLISRLDIGS